MTTIKPQRQSNPPRCEDLGRSPEGDAPDGTGDKLATIVAVAKRHWHRVHKWILRYRTLFSIAASALFFGGLAISFAVADFRWQSLALPQVLLILLVLGPLTIALAALSLQVTAAAVGREVPFFTAFSVTAIANIAQLLPLPGGAMVRGAALVKAGAKLGESASIVTLTSSLTFFLAIAVSGIPLASAKPSAGYPVLAAGLIGSGFSLAPIVLRAGVKPALAMIGVRLLVMAIGVIRFVVAFGAIGAELDPLDAAVFVVCAALASTMTLVPAGLGVTETLAAAVALAVDISPAVAFMAVALNRALGIATSAIVVGGTFLAGKPAKKLM